MFQVSLVIYNGEIQVKVPFNSSLNNETLLTRLDEISFEPFVVGNINESDGSGN